MKKGDKTQHWMRGVQKNLLKAKGYAADMAGKAASAAQEKLQEIDQATGISEKATEVGAKVRQQVQELDERYELKEKASHLGAYTGEKARRVADIGNDLLVQSRAKGLAEQAIQRTQGAVVAPTKEAISRAGVNKLVGRQLDQLERLYGKSRSLIKPYFAAEDPRELLTNARTELAKVSACIMQISSNDSEKLASQFSSAVLAKATGAAATTSLLALVATFGTAGTGTAISSLSGAAAANATLAWVGGLVGGGMAAGAVLTGGIGLVAGLTAYKLLGSERRDFESLSEREQRVVQTCWLTIAIIDEYLAGRLERFTEREAEQLLVNVFRPLQEELQHYQEDICANLDGKHAVAFRQHILADFPRVVIEGFEDFISGYPFKGFASAEYVIGGVFYALLSRSVVGDDIESQLVLEALRRSSAALTNASESELGEYLRNMTPESLKGLGSNVKGIYHELLYVQNYNGTHDDTKAEVFVATNHPGADIRIMDIESGEVIEQFQLKAVMDAAKIDLHLERYPNISVLATNEVAEQLTEARVAGSGFDNEVLQARVGENLESVADNSIGDRSGDAALFAAGIASTRELLEMLRGERSFPDATTNVLKGAGTAAAATALAAYLFG